MVALIKMFKTTHSLNESLIVGRLCLFEFRERIWIKLFSLLSFSPVPIIYLSLICEENFIHISRECVYVNWI